MVGKRRNRAGRERRFLNQQAKLFVILCFAKATTTILSQCFQKEVLQVSVEAFHASYNSKCMNSPPNRISNVKPLLFEVRSGVFEVFSGMSFPLHLCLPLWLSAQLVCMWRCQVFSWLHFDKRTGIFVLFLSSATEKQQATHVKTPYRENKLHLCQVGFHKFYTNCYFYWASHINWCKELLFHCIVYRNGYGCWSQKLQIVETKKSGNTICPHKKVASF